MSSLIQVQKGWKDVSSSVSAVTQFHSGHRFFFSSSSLSLVPNPNPRFVGNGIGFERARMVSEALISIDLGDTGPTCTKIKLFKRDGNRLKLGFYLSAGTPLSETFKRSAPEKENQEVRLERLAEDFSRGFKNFADTADAKPLFGYPQCAVVFEDLAFQRLSNLQRFKDVESVFNTIALKLFQDKMDDPNLQHPDRVVNRVLLIGVHEREQAGPAVCLH